jgi:hypothetical protein
MNKEKELQNNTGRGEESGQKHPSPFKESLEQVEHSGPSGQEGRQQQEDDIAQEQQRKEALTERD